MYYYYYYKSVVKLNFRFEATSNELSNHLERISIVDIEKLLRCLNTINHCAIESTVNLNNDYNESDYLLQLDKISYNSPLDLTVIVPLAASIVGIPLLILQSIEKIIKIKKDFEERKQKKEKQKLQLDIKEKSKERIMITDPEMQKKLTIMISSESFKKNSQEMSTLPFKILRYEVQFGVEEEDEYKKDVLY